MMPTQNEAGVQQRRKKDVCIGFKMPVGKPEVTYLSITARHSFRHVNRLPRRSLKVPEVAVTGGGVCLHSGSSIGIGAGLMLNVAPKNDKYCVS